MLFETRAQVIGHSNGCLSQKKEIIEALLCFQLIWQVSFFKIVRDHVSSSHPADDFGVL